MGTYYLNFSIKRFALNTKWFVLLWCAQMNTTQSMSLLYIAYPPMHVLFCSNTTKGQHSWSDCPCDSMLRQVSFTSLALHMGLWYYRESTRLTHPSFSLSLSTGEKSKAGDNDSAPSRAPSQSLSWPALCEAPGPTRSPGSGGEEPQPWENGADPTGGPTGTSGTSHGRLGRQRGQDHGGPEQVSV